MSYALSNHCIGRFSGNLQVTSWAWLGNVYFVSHIAPYGASQREMRSISAELIRARLNSKRFITFLETKVINSKFYISLRLFDLKINIIK